MWMRGRGNLVRLGAVAGLLWGCNSGGYSGDGPMAARDLGGLTDLQSRADDLGPDLRRPASDALAFGMPQSYAGMGSAHYVAVQDVNRDGKLDLLSAGQGLATLLGKGDGSFFDAVETPTPEAAQGFAAGDLNGDGNPDVVLARRSALETRLGRGDGSFQSPRAVPIPDQALNLALGDVDRDGKLDLAVGIASDSMAPQYVHVLPGLGDGTFGPAVKVQTGLNQQTVRLADLNRDGSLDLATSNYDSQDVSVALGRGDGTFFPTQTLASEPSPLGLEAVDLSGDGVLDLVVSSERRASVSIHLGRGDGTFLPAQAVAVANERNTYALAVGDLNGDAVPDLAMSSANPGTQLSVLLGKGDGGFLPSRAFSVGKFLKTIGLADFNADGLTDVALADGQLAGRIHVLINTTAAP